MRTPDREQMLISEPSKTKGGKNPEIVVKNSRFIRAVEVNAPALLAHQQTRTVKPVQIASRFAFPPDSSMGVEYTPKELVWWL